MNRSAAGLAALCFGVAVGVRLVVAAPVGYWLPVLAEGVGAGLVFCTLMAGFEAKTGVVLRLWGLEWTRDEACCHFFITGATGTGKTARAVVPIVHGLRSTLPDTGVLAVDSKGALWKPLSAMAESLGQKESLRLIRVRPTHIAPAQWTPPLRLNILGDASVPWSTYAKIVVDTATASGQRGGQAFSKETARDAITHAMHALAVAELPVTLANVHDTICISTETALLLARLAELEDDPNFTFHYLAIGDPAAAAAVFALYPDLQGIVHLAAQVGVGHSLANPQAFLNADLSVRFVVL